MGRTERGWEGLGGKKRGAAWPGRHPDGGQEKPNGGRQRGIMNCMIVFLYLCIILVQQEEKSIHT